MVCINSVLLTTVVRYNGCQQNRHVTLSFPGLCIPSPFCVCRYMYIDFKVPIKHFMILISNLCESDRIALATKHPQDPCLFWGWQIKFRHPETSSKNLLNTEYPLISGLPIIRYYQDYKGLSMLSRDRLLVRCNIK